MGIPSSDSIKVAAIPGFNRTPLSELSSKTRTQLSCMLNDKSNLYSKEGYECDWRGIASLAGLRNRIDENVIMPMDKVLDTWIQHNPQIAEVGYLEEFLGIIDRWDVCEDIQKNLSEDTKRYQLKKLLLSLESNAKGRIRQTDI